MESAEWQYNEESPPAFSSSFFLSFSLYHGRAAQFCIVYAAEISALI